MGLSLEQRVITKNTKLQYIQIIFSHVIAIPLTLQKPSEVILKKKNII